MPFAVSRGEVQLPGWGRLDRAGRVLTSARLLGLQPSAAEEGWGRRRPAVPGPSSFPSFHKPGQRASASEGALVPLRVGMETTLLAAAAAGAFLACVYRVLCADPGTGSARFLPEASVPTWRKHNRGFGDP